MEFRSFHWLSRMVRVRISFGAFLYLFYCTLLYFGGICGDTISPIALVTYEMAITNSYPTRARGRIGLEWLFYIWHSHMLYLSNAAKFEIARCSVLNGFQIKIDAQILNCIQKLLGFQFSCNAQDRFLLRLDIKSWKTLAGSKVVVAIKKINWFWKNKQFRMDKILPTAERRNVWFSVRRLSKLRLRL